MHGRFSKMLPVLIAIDYVLGALWSVTSAHADREIVFGARYYAPPHSKIKTHFHIYLINPDGTGTTQLTFGAHDDTEPFWAPDGKSIVFFRDEQFSIVGAHGGSALPLSANIDGATRGDLHWSPDGRTLAVPNNDPTRPLVYLIDTHTRRIRIVRGIVSYQWSPDGAKRFIQYADHASVIDGAGKVTQILSLNKNEMMSHVIWVDSDTLFGLRNQDGDKITAFSYRVPMKREHHFVLRFAATANPDQEDPSQVSPVYLLRIPGSQPSILYVSDSSNSTVRPNNDFYRVGPQTGVATLLTLGKQFVTFSPDGTHFCTSPGRDTSPYETKGVAGNRTVWTALLQIGVSNTGKAHTISKGLVWVKGADWLHPIHG